MCVGGVAWGLVLVGFLSVGVSKKILILVLFFFVVPVVPVLFPTCSFGMCQPTGTIAGKEGKQE